MGVGGGLGWSMLPLGLINASLGWSVVIGCCGVFCGFVGLIDATVAVVAAFTTAAIATVT